MSDHVKKTLSYYYFSLSWLRTMQRVTLPQQRHQNHYLHIYIRPTVNKCTVSLYINIDKWMLNLHCPWKSTNCVNFDVSVPCICLPFKFQNYDCFIMQLITAASTLLNYYVMRQSYLLFCYKQYNVVAIITWNN